MSAPGVRQTSRENIASIRTNEYLSRLSANYDDRMVRKERKRTEKSVSDEQVLLITCERISLRTLSS